MKTFENWLKERDPELHEGWGKNLAMAAALGAGGMGLYNKGASDAQPGAQPPAAVQQFDQSVAYQQDGITIRDKGDHGEATVQMRGHTSTIGKRTNARRTALKVKAAILKAAEMQQGTIKGFRPISYDDQNGVITATYIWRSVE